MNFSLDDRIINSQCLNILNILLNVFCYFDVLIKNLEGLSTSDPNIIIAKNGKYTRISKKMSIEKKNEVKSLRWLK